MDWKEFFERYSIDYADFYITKDKKKVKEYANKLGFPVVLKAYDLTHKSDKGGVIFVGCKDRLDDAIKRISKLSKTFLIQKRISGREIIVGAGKDKIFGSYIMLGIGGTYVEALKDVAYGINPIDSKTARMMIESLKLKEVLGKFRGQRDARKDVEKLLVKLSKIAYENKLTFEFNPMIITEDSIKVVDFR